MAHVKKKKKKQARGAPHSAPCTHTRFELREVTPSQIWGGFFFLPKKLELTGSGSGAIQLANNVPH